MPLTKDFKTTAMSRAHRDKEFCNAMLDKNPKSLMRMLSPKGNLTSKSLFDIFYEIQKLKKAKFNVIVKQSLCKTAKYHLYIFN